MTAPEYSFQPHEILDINQTRLTPDQQRLLLALARLAIKSDVDEKRGSVVAIDDPVLNRCAGAFVTLRRKNELEYYHEGNRTFSEGRLRGCIGHMEADKPLAMVVGEMAVRAASADFRFPPVTPEELEEIEIEISVLSALQPIDDFRQIEIGRHGLVIAAGGRRGLLLPQVAKRYGWLPEDFVWGVCQKAGLPGDAWPGQATVYVFTTQSFSEDEWL